jgi:hypothetical protein
MTNWFKAITVIFTHTIFVVPTVEIVSAWIFHAFIPTIIPMTNFIIFVGTGCTDIFRAFSTPRIVFKVNPDTCFSVSTFKLRAGIRKAYHFAVVMIAIFLLRTAQTNILNACSNEVLGLEIELDVTIIVASASSGLTWIVNAYVTG